MIVPMKKIHLIAQKKDMISVLGTVQELGLIHVEHQDIIEGYQLQERREEVMIITQALDILRKTKLDVKQAKSFDWTEVVSAVLEAQGEIEQYKERISKTQSFIYQWEAWGDFDPADLKALESSGIYVGLYEIPVKEVNKLPAKYIAENVSVVNGVARCMIISRQKIDVHFPKLEPPAISLRAMTSQQDEDRIKMDQALKKVHENACYVEFLEMTLQERENILRFEEVEQGMLESGPITVLKGFIPASSCPQFEAKAKQEHWGILMEDPADEDTVPTLMKNSKWVDIIKPMFSIMNIVPGYREKDISIFFLIFFTIFFGILVGDAGYGTIFLLITLLAHIKLGKSLEDHSFFYLSYLLSTVTIIWGILTGTVFGTLLLSAYFKPLLPWLTDAKNVQLLCFSLGVVHLTIAHIWRSLSRGFNLGGFAEIGWIMMLWGSFFLANMMLLGHSLPGFVRYLYIVGIVLVIADIVAQKKDIGVNMILFVFSVINTFGDIVSYIRLFAVGLAGVAVADAFNQMALGIGFGNIFTSIGAFLVLGFVHLFLNLALCVMSVLVHGVRLNVLEFSGHLGMEWSGIKYAPFRKIHKS
jgi:V/A-type H+-transporting ATPase subunit I